MLIALVVLGTAAIFYGYYLDVRNVEAEILSKQIGDCLNSRVIDMENINYSKYQYNFLDYCGINNIDRFYVNITIIPLSSLTSAQPKTFEQGDSGIRWVKDVLSSVDYENLQKYNPGYYATSFPINIISSGKKVRAYLSMEVVVAHEL
jgi:hypothetical protein